MFICTQAPNSSKIFIYFLNKEKLTLHESSENGISPEKGPIGQKGNVLICECLKLYQWSAHICELNLIQGGFIYKLPQEIDTGVC